MRAVILYAKRRPGNPINHGNHKAIGLMGEEEQNTCTELDDFRFRRV